MPFFFFKIILAIQGPLQSHINLRIDISTSAKKKKKEEEVGILIRIALNLQVTLGSIDILKLSLPGTSLVVQRLGLSTFTAGATFDPWSGS